MTKIKIWTATIDAGDGSSYVKMYPTEKVLRDHLNLDDEDFQPGSEIPVEVDYTIFDISNCEIIEE